MSLVARTREIAPLELLGQFAAAGGAARFYWLSADRALELAGAGEVRALEASGPARLAVAAERAAALWRDLALEGPAVPGFVGPRLVGGFAFWDDAAPDTDWRGFPPLRFWLPRVLWARAGERCFRTDVGPVAAECEARTSSCPRHAGASGFSASAAPSQAEFTALVARATAAIHAGEIEKVVLARACTLLQHGGFDPARVLAALCDAQPGCAVYAVGLAGATFVGATPERLVRRDGAAVQADALAGSAARGRNPEEDARRGRALFESAKERGEHAIVRRAVLSALAPVCSALEASETPALRRLEGIQHLHTAVSGRLAAEPPPSALELAARLFPTPAVGGEPRAAALDFLRHHEDARRGWYSGGVGWLAPGGDGELCVALRSALLRGDAAMLHAGVGVVAGSTPEAELEETRWKLASALGALVEL